MEKVIAVYDHKDVVDRFTIVTSNKQGIYYDCLCLSSNPDSPLGFSQWDGCIIGDHLGRKMGLTDLPTNVRNHAIRRLKDAGVSLTTQDCE